MKLAEVETPKPQRGEVQVAAQATAVNRADLIQREGKYPAPPGAPQNIPGLEFAGIVNAIGDAVTEWKVGDRVFGIIGGGTYAQYLVTHARTLSRIPDNLSFEEAAAVPEAFITAYDAMVSQCGLKSGERILINGASSGVGTAAIQIAGALGATTIGTTRSSSKKERLAKLGLHHLLIIEDGKFADKIGDITGGAGVDVIIELIGGNYFNEDLDCISASGRIIIVGLLAGASINVNLRQILFKRLRVFGTTLRARPLEEKIAVAQTFTKYLLPLFESGRLHPVIDKIFPLSEAADAHEYLAGNDTFGKVILSINH